MSRILVTGCNGQLGWELRRTLAPLGDIIAIDQAELDLRDANAIRAFVRATKPTWIVNPAAYTAVDQAEREPELAYAINAAAPAAFAEEATACGAKLIHYSTDYVFDGSQSEARVETDGATPVSVYGASKLEGERRIAAAHGAHWILRTSWLYGVRGKNFLLTMLRLAGTQQKLRVVADQFGAPTWARMVAEATAALIVLQREGAATAALPSGLYHLTASGRTSWHGFASRIVEWGAERGLCPRIPVDAIATTDYPTPARRPAVSVLDSTLLARSAGIRLPSWEDGLRLCLDDLAARSDATARN